MEFLHGAVCCVTANRNKKRLIVNNFEILKSSKLFVDDVVWKVIHMLLQLQRRFPVWLQ